jgi:hypothetical protein
MGKSTPKTPEAPNPQQLAAAQAQANAGTARVQQRLNMIDENTPWYTTQFTSLGDPTRNADGSTRPPTATSAQAPGSVSRASGGMTQERWDSMDPSWQAQNPESAFGLGGGSSGDAPPGASGDYDPLEGEPAYYNQDRYSRTIELNPEDQAILDQERRLTQGIGGLAEGQIPRIAAALNTTPGYDGLPERSTGIDPSRMASVNPNFSSGGIRSSIDFSGMPELQTGGVATGFDTVGGIQRGVADAGPIQRSVNPDGQWDYNDVGGPQRSLNIQDPTQFTTGVADTLFGASKSRLDPRIGQSREELRQSLADRGIPEDSPAGQRELSRFEENASDAYQQAEASATDRAAAQAAQLFGMDLSRFSAENQAQGQEFGQTAMQRGDLLDQGLSLGTFANNAQGQQYGQNLSSMEAANRAQQQQYGQNMGAAEFNNLAQNQIFGQSLGARQQLGSEQEREATFGNQAQAQGFGQQQAREQLSLALRNQNLTEQMSDAQLRDLARQAGFDERMLARDLPIRDALMLMGAAG